MSKRLQSKYSVCKKLTCFYKNIWGLQSKDSLKSLSFRKRKRRVSSFGNILCVKQSLKLFYSNLKERTLIRYTKIGFASSSITINKIISILERRLDSVLFRSCFVISFQEARQLISHGFVTVNGLKTTYCGEKLRKSDLVLLNIRHVKRNTFFNTIRSRSLPNHLELDLKNYVIVFLWDTNLKSTYYPIKIKYFNLIRFFK